MTQECLESLFFIRSGRRLRLPGGGGGHLAFPSSVAGAQDVSSGLARIFQSTATNARPCRRHGVHGFEPCGWLAAISVDYR